jgi:hypothetical protein
MGPERSFMQLSEICSTRSLIELSNIRTFVWGLEEYDSDVIGRGCIFLCGMIFQCCVHNQAYD